MSDLRLTGTSQSHEGLSGNQSEALKLSAETLSSTHSERQTCRPDCGNTCTLVDLTEQARSKFHYSEAALKMIWSVGSFSLDDSTRPRLRSVTSVRDDSDEAYSGCAKSSQLWSGWLEPTGPASGGPQCCDRDYAENAPNEVLYKELDTGFDVEMYLNGIPKQVHQSGRRTTTRWLVRVHCRNAFDNPWSVHLFTTAWKRSQDKWRETKRGAVYQIQSDRIGKCKKALSRYIKDQTPWEMRVKESFSFRQSIPLSERDQQQSQCRPTLPPFLRLSSLLSCGHVVTRAFWGGGSQGRGASYGVPFAVCISVQPPIQTFKLSTQHRKTEMSSFASGLDRQSTFQRNSTDGNPNGTVLTSDGVTEKESPAGSTWDSDDDRGIDPSQSGSDNSSIQTQDFLASMSHGWKINPYRCPPSAQPYMMTRKGSPKYPSHYISKDVLVDHCLILNKSDDLENVSQWSIEARYMLNKLPWSVRLVVTAQERLPEYIDRPSRATVETTHAPYVFWVGSDLERCKEEIMNDQKSWYAWNDGCKPGNGDHLINFLDDCQKLLDRKVLEIESKSKKGSL
ncbi:hypothetical protein HD553DRAFT_324544 [Filobasidium floriforme]|uniref:uncharacterized protein n=1 Tax=Filobasidium floriforme TaxID=5210 RepID=UPI001E8D1A7D|nr:uncharacterized protein HD553DRAFT_324544 [Filobasidium floriforme]KAH8083664.1 hypothetical protein HD553DRAFT_324544 [Filobasidium floriforme]